MEYYGIFKEVLHLWKEDKKPMFYDLQKDIVEHFFKDYMEEKNAEKQQYNQAKEYNDFLDSLIEELNYALACGFQVLGITNNKKEKVFVYLKEYPNRGEIYIGNSNYPTDICQNRPRLYYRTIKREDKLLFYLTDIQAVNKQLGNGSILIRSLVQLAKKQKVREIHGNILSLEESDFSILQAFFTKHHFTIEDSDDPTYLKKFLLYTHQYY